MGTGSKSIDEQLRNAIRGSDYALVQQLLDDGGALGWRDQNGISTLHIAAERAEQKMLEFVLSRPEADVSITDDDGQTPMHYAARASRVDNMETLKSKGALIDAAALDGRTPLMMAAHRDHVAAVDWLLVNKAAPDKQDNQMRTAMHYAVSRKYLKSTIALVKGGADATIPDKNGVSAVSLATIMDGGGSVAGEFNVSQFLNAIEVQKDIRHGTTRSLHAPRTAKFSRKPQQQS